MAKRSSKKHKLSFISLVDDTGRVSSLSYGGVSDTGMLRVVGVLPHGTEFLPQTVGDAEKLIKFLEDIIEANTK